jgi:hypothetical protein
MTIQIQIRRDTASAWSVANPVLAQGELAAEYDTGKFKIGDGIVAWNALAYSSGIPGANGYARVEVWVSGVTYIAGALVSSIISEQTYRRITTGAGTLDPSVDSGYWKSLALPTASAVIFTASNFGAF